jgi:AraC-like DNA-binding protein
MSRLVSPQVNIFVPSEPLTDYVTFFYTVATEVQVDDFLYPEWGNVRFVLSGDWHVAMVGYSLEPQGNILFGHTDRCARVTATSGRCVGFGLTPIGWHQFIGESAAVMANRCRPLAHELGQSPNEIHKALLSKDSDQEKIDILDQLLVRSLQERAPEPPTLVALDLALKRRPSDVRAFAAEMGCSARTLQRMCLSLYGFAPKRLIRRQRFMETLGKFRAAVGKTLEEAIDTEYFDHPQFYRDFREFMGMSVRTYFSDPRTLMGQAAASQKKAGVTLSFKLPANSAHQLSVAGLNTESSDF